MVDVFEISSQEIGIVSQSLGQAVPRGKWNEFTALLTFPISDPEFCGRVVVDKYSVLIPIHLWGYQTDQQVGRVGKLIELGDRIMKS